MRLRQLRRLVWYIAVRLLVVCIVLSLCVVCFYYAMNLANIQVIVKDGMAARAEAVIMSEDTEELSKYFFSSFLQTDSVLQTLSDGSSPYQNYNVTGIDHRIDMGFFWTWPWDESVRFEITESIPHIDGRVKGSKADEVVAAGGSSAVYPPSWKSARYRVTLSKEDGQWRIKNLVLIEYVDTDTQETASQ